VGEPLKSNVMRSLSTMEVPKPMKNLVQLFGAAVFALSVNTFTPWQVGNPEIRELNLVAELPPELPQRVMGLAYDGKSLWATIYLGQGRYAKLDPVTLSWTSDNEVQRSHVIASVAREFSSPGGICFDNSRIWVVGAYGASFGSINAETWKVEKLFQGKQREDRGSQTYSSIACDGSYIWIAWHWFRYDLPSSQTQLLLKVDPETGKTIAAYATPGGTRNDGVAGLTWDGSKLWYVKDKKLSSIDPSTGAVTAQYVLDGIKRPSGLAWAMGALWISEFEGKIWRLSFVM
jgi:hypothetical protein